MVGNAISNTFMSYSSVGNREDLGDIIYNISPMSEPFLGSIGKSKATATFHEWNQDSLAAASASNFSVQGDDITTFTAVDPTVRLGNRTQILRKEFLISGTQEVILKAGRKSEVAYQTMKKGREIKRDLELTLLTSQAAVAASAGTAPKMATVPAWLISNTSNGAGAGANPAGTGADTRVAGTPRAFTEALLKPVLQSIFSNSGEDADTILVPPSQKVVLSGFAGNATRFIDAQAKEIVSNVLVYSGDFGEYKVVTDRFMPTTYALIYNSDLWALSTLRPMSIKDLAVTGDAMKKLMLTEVTLESRNEAGSGAVYDLS